MAGQYEQLSCPFCDKGRITCLYFPHSFSVKTMRIANMSKPKKVRNPDIWLIQSGCPNCGRSQEEVEKELRKRGII